MAVILAFFDPDSAEWLAPPLWIPAFFDSDGAEARGGLAGVLQQTPPSIGMKTPNQALFGITPRLHFKVESKNLYTPC